MIVTTEAGAIELDETSIPPCMRERARTWFAGEVARLSRLHGAHWPANREWLLDYLQAEVTDRAWKELKNGV